METRWTRYGLGLDLSKDRIHAVLGGLTRDREFKTIARKAFGNNTKGFSELEAWIEHHRKEKELECQVVLEVTGVYHEGVLHHLHAKGYTVCLELAKRVKRYLQVLGHKSKNDRLDGAGLAQLAVERKLQPWRPVSAQILEIRAMLRHRRALMQARDQFRNQEHAQEHGAVPNPVVQASLKQMIDALEGQMGQVEGQVKALVQRDPALHVRLQRIVESVKGLGWLSVLTVVAETNGFASFSSMRQLVSYAGYDVVENSSGNFTGKTRISKQGNARIRSALYMPSLCMAKFKVQPFYALYERLLERNGGLKKKALVAIQRKLLVLIYTLWKRGEAFDPTRYGITKAVSQDRSSLKEVAPI